MKKILINNEVKISKKLKKGFGSAMKKNNKFIVSSCLLRASLRSLRGERCSAPCATSKWRPLRALHSNSRKCVPV